MPTDYYNSDLLHPTGGGVVVELRYYHRGTMDDNRDDWIRGLRYFSLLDTTPSQRADRLDGVHFTGRMSIDETIHSTFYQCTYIVPAPIMSDTDPKPIEQLIHDYSISQNVVIKQHAGRYYAFGGEDSSGNRPPPQYELDDRDGIRVLEADSFEAMRQNTSWRRPVHASRSDRNVILPGNHPGCVTERNANGVCEYDGMVSAVFLNGRWHIHTRSNLKEHGGRFMQVARSTSSDVYGPYEPFEQVSIAGYDPRRDEQWANIYFLLANVHPLDPQVMIGMMPVNWGEEGQDNGDGDSHICMSISCDGVHWSSLTPLVSTRGLEGRTYDHPVSGFILQNGTVYWYLHRDVPNISPASYGESAILEYTFKTDALMAMTRQAKAGLQGCEPSPPSHPPPPRPPPNPGPPPPQPSPPSPSPPPQPGALPPASRSNANTTASFAPPTFPIFHPPPPATPDLATAAIAAAAQLSALQQKVAVASACVIGLAFIGIGFIAGCSFRKASSRTSGTRGANAGIDIQQLSERSARKPRRLVEENVDVTPDHRGDEVLASAGWTA